MVTGRRSALIVACDDYQDSALQKLRAPTRDAEALTRVLQDPLIGGFEVRSLVNEPAHVVTEAVEEFFTDRGTEDLLLLHFSCHGVKDADGELYFAVANTKLRCLGATGVAADFVNRRMNRSRSRRIVLLLDCCYAGAFERGMTHRAGAGVNVEEQLSGRGRAVITASSAMEYAFESGNLADVSSAGPSAFTGALVEGLASGEADRDQDGLITLDELYDYVYAKVRASSPHQTPGKWVFGVQGELHIARRTRRLSEPISLPIELEQSINSPLSSVRGAAVSELRKLLAGRHLGLAEAAQQALQRLTEDDSRSVSAAAVSALRDDVRLPRLPPTAQEEDLPSPRSPRPSAVNGRPPSRARPVFNDARPPASPTDGKRPSTMPKIHSKPSVVTPQPSGRPSPVRDSVPADSPRPGDPVLLQRVGGALTIAAAVMMAINPFVPFAKYSDMAVVDGGPEVVFPALAMATLVGAAGICLLSTRAGSLVGSGMLLGEGVTLPWFLCNQWQPWTAWGPAAWLWVAALLVLVVSTGITGLSVYWMRDVELRFRLPLSVGSWILLSLGVLTMLLLAIYESSDAEEEFARESWGDTLFVIAALVVPACAAFTVPRRFQLAMVVGWCGAAGVVAYYTIHDDLDAGIDPTLVVVFALILPIIIATTAVSGRWSVSGRSRSNV